MTTGINFWDSSIWSFIVSLSILLIAMLAANMLGRAVPAIKRLMIPSSVLGGFLILLIRFATWRSISSAVSQTYSFIFDHRIKYDPFQIV